VSRTNSEPKTNTRTQTGVTTRKSASRKSRTTKARKVMRPKPHIVKVGTRGSPLALAQAETFSRLLESVSGGLIYCEIETYKTQGDQIQDRRLQDAGGKGLFTRELDIVQQTSEVDVCVHSLKDVPNELAEGLVIGCYLEREDPRDALIGPYSALRDLPPGARLGTASLRRASQALYIRPDLEIVMFRGSVQTRLKKLQDGLADATLLAAAGLNRLGMTNQAAGFIPVTDMIPAVGQGIVCATIRADAPDWLKTACTAIDDNAARLAATAERAFLKRLDGSCRTPIAGHFCLTDTGAHMVGEVLADDGSTRWWAEGVLDRTPSELDAAELGLWVAEDIAEARNRKPEGKEPTP